MRMPILAVGAYLALASPPLAGPALGSPWPDLSQPTRADTRRDEGAHDAALIVAIEDYAHVPDVPGARRNGADWRAWLRARGVPHVKVLQDAAAVHGFDGRARPRGILTALEQTAAKVGPGGTLWFVFIGHGAPNGDPAQPDGLVLAQSVQQTADGLQLAGIPVQAELLPRLRPAAKGARAVAVLDACFSGKVDADQPLVAGLQPVFVAGVGAVPPGVTLLTAAKGDEYAGALPGLGRPAFSYLALGGLQGWADQDGDGQVSGREVRQFAEDALFQVVTGRQQTPDAQGDLEGALARAGASKPDLAGIARTLAPRPTSPLANQHRPRRSAPMSERRHETSLEDGSGETKADREGCRAMYEKVLDFELEDEPNGIAQRVRTTLLGHASQFVDRCAGQATRAEIDCVLSAKDKAAYEACK